jgi:DNA processing protein
MILSELTPTSYLSKKNFIDRNRIIAGISDGVLVAESRIKGGGLITAKIAFDYNREVFAIPGKPDDVSFAGCNNLIETGIAHIATSGESIAIAMNWDTKKGKQLKFDFSGLTELEKSIIIALRQYGELSVDELCSIVNSTTSALSLPLLQLEIAGHIIHLSANRYVLY